MHPRYPADCRRLAQNAKKGNDSLLALPMVVLSLDGASGGPRPHPDWRLTRAKPRGSRQVSGLPRSPATVENRAIIGVEVSGWNTAALV